jgi:hypothetical protein
VTCVCVCLADCPPSPSKCSSFGPIITRCLHVARHSYVIPTLIARVCVLLVLIVCFWVDSVALATALRASCVQSVCGLLCIHVRGYALVRMCPTFQTRPVFDWCVVGLFVLLFWYFLSCVCVCCSCGFAAAQTVKAVDSFMWKHIVSLIFLLYICWCTFLCIFRLKLFGLLELSGNRCVGSPVTLVSMGNATALCGLSGKPTRIRCVLTLRSCAGCNSPFRTTFCK